MHKPFFILLLLLSACTLPAEKEERASSKKIDTTIIETNDANAAISVNTSNTQDLPVVQKIKNPSGIYRTILPLEEKFEQTILFIAISLINYRRNISAVKRTVLLQQLETGRLPMDTSGCIKTKL